MDGRGAGIAADHGCRRTMGEDPRRMPPPRPVAGLPAPEPEAVASAWLAELLAGAPLAAAPRIASEELVALAPVVVEAVLAGLSGEARFAGPSSSEAVVAGLSGEARFAGPGSSGEAVPAGLSGEARFAGPGSSGEALARLAAPLPPGGPAAVVAAGEALRRAVAGALAPALAAAPDAAGALHDRLAWVVAELVRAALAEPELTDTRPRWVVLVEVDDADRLAAAGDGAALDAAGRALRAALPRSARCTQEGPGRWRVTGVGAGAGADEGAGAGRSAGRGGAGLGGGAHADASAGVGNGAGVGGDPGAGGGAGAAPGRTAATLADVVAAVAGPHGTSLRATAGEGATAEEAEERLLAARAAGVPALS